jgi:hypothetical protein
VAEEKKESKAKAPHKQGAYIALVGIDDDKTGKRFEVDEEMVGLPEATVKALMKQGAVGRVGSDKKEKKDD